MSNLNKKATIRNKVEWFYQDVKYNQVSNATHIKSGSTEINGLVIDTVKFCKAFNEVHLAAFTTVERYLRQLKSKEKVTA